MTLKYLFDRIFSLLGLIFLSPVMLVVAILIRIKMGNQVMFKQERVGKDGKLFTIFKFRTMKEDVEGSSISMAGDERILPAGVKLRKYRLDELPQLWNVLKGDMAFIGPRPEREFYIKQIMERDPRYVYLYQIRPGVTSYATLYNGYTDTIEKMLRRLELDLYYLEHRSWLFDFKILFKTFVNIVFGKKF